MFNGFVNCTIMEVKSHTKRMEGDETNAISLVYKVDFTEALALAMGPQAENARAAMVGEKESNGTVTAVKFAISSDSLRATFKAGAGSMELDDIASIVAAAKLPTAEGGTEPLLMAKITFIPGGEGEEQFGFFTRHQGMVLSMRLDRKQLELPLGGEEE